MNKEHRIKRIIKKYLRTNEVHKRNSRDEIHQARSLRRDRSVKASISQKSRENKTQQRNVRVV